MSRWISAACVGLLFPQAPTSVARAGQSVWRHHRSGAFAV